VLIRGRQNIIQAVHTPTPTNNVCRSYLKHIRNPDSSIHSRSALCSCLFINGPGHSSRDPRTTTSTRMAGNDIQSSDSDEHSHVCVYCHV